MVHQHFSVFFTVLCVLDVTALLPVLVWFVLCFRIIRLFHESTFACLFVASFLKPGPFIP